jgi:hypothetical protein
MDADERGWLCGGEGQTLFLSAPICVNLRQKKEVETADGRR